MSTSKETPFLAASLLGAALLVLGIGFMAPAGEQAKLAYNGDLWCVSNFIEERPYRRLPDGRAAKDPLLIGKEDWIVREQVTAQSKDEAENKVIANSHGAFTRSNADELRDKLSSSDKDFFLGHFNEGATVPGPCLGTGDKSAQTGRWLNDVIREKCFGIGDAGQRRNIFAPDTFTAEQIDQYIEKKAPNSPLKGKGKVFVEAGKKYGVNPAFLLGITNAESSLGLQCLSGTQLVGTNNAFGVRNNGQFVRYASYEAGIEDAAKLAASSGYKGLNGTMREFRLKWCGLEESESSTTLSDGHTIDYKCGNGSSSWEGEVSAVIEGLIEMFPASTGTGSCKMKTGSLHLDGKGDVTLPLKGKFVGEDHHLTKEESYQPSGERDRIKEHYNLTDKYTNSVLGAGFKHTTVWTPAAGGGSVGSGCCGRPSASEEPWMINTTASGAGKPAPGTKMIIRNPKKPDLAVVAVVGYEYGPEPQYVSSRNWIVGGQEEIAHVLGIDTNSEVEIGFPEDQNLQVGPIKCSENITQTEPGKLVPGAPDYCPQTAPASGPSSGEDFRNSVADVFAQQLSANALSQQCAEDTKSGKAIVDAAMKYAPNADGTTNYKYSHNGPESTCSNGKICFHCSGFVKQVLEDAKAAGANVVVPGSAYAPSQAKEGTLINQINTKDFEIAGKGSILRQAKDLPPESLLQPGDMIFFGTSTSSPRDGENFMYDTLDVGHVGIYIGGGRFIHSTDSDINPNRDSASRANPFTYSDKSTNAPIPANPEGKDHAQYNGVKIDSFSGSYYLPRFYLSTRRFTTASKNCSIYSGSYGFVEGLGSTFYPGGDGENESFGSCHGKSVCHPGNISGHGVYKNRDGSQGDAVDITPANTVVYAAFDGTAYPISGSLDSPISIGTSTRGGGVKVVSTNGRVAAYYYHVIPTASGPIKGGSIIGRVGAAGIGHIHFELLVDGKSVHGDVSRRGDESAYQRSLWDNMRKVLGLK